MNGSLVVVDDVAKAFAQLVVDHAKSNAPGPSSLAFSGGSTARDCYRELSRSASTVIDWKNVTGWWGDERCVPLTDIDSNFRLVQDALLKHVGPLAAVHPMQSEIPDPAFAYEELLRASPPIDLIHLGLGPDGHTASLFPDSDALDSPEGRLVVSNRDPLANNPHERLTFTFEAISQCRQIVFTVAGAAKTEALHRVLDGDLSAPATHISGAEVVWLVDNAAMGARTSR
ncbi:MAG: 6-phosphogluconolactonase [Actinobacteria bacterium]|nr:6-phosphogluconolactonase [Actinomycetota bacterium]